MSGLTGTDQIRREAELLNGALRGERAAIEQLVRDNNPRLYRIARGIVGDEYEAEDILQEAYIRAFRNLGSFKSQSSLATWLSRIVINEAYGRIRRRRVMVELDVLDRYPSGDDMRGGSERVSDDPESVAAGRELCVALERAIDALSADFRIVLVARVIEGFSVEETADLLGIEPGTVKTRLHRAHRRLQQEMRKRIGPVLEDAFALSGRRCEALAKIVVGKLLPASRAGTGQAAIRVEESRRGSVAREEGVMSKFTIQPHGRLQEWIAHELGYFTAEGLDYEFQESPVVAQQKATDPEGKVVDLLAGAFESYKAGGGNKGVKSDISCACHWAVNQASADSIGTMWGKSYVVTPGGIMAPPDSPISRPEQLARQEVAVGYHSGSHFATVQALEAMLDPDDIRLRFVGAPWARVDVALDRDVAATSVWGLTYQVLEHLGFRKIVDTSFMIGFMFPSHVDPGDVEKYMNGLRRAQMELDLAPEKYKHLYAKEIPDRYRNKVDVRQFSPGERIVFLPYTEDMYRRTQDWIRARGIFDHDGTLAYGEAVLA